MRPLSRPLPTDEHRDLEKKLVLVEGELLGEGAFSRVCKVNGECRRGTCEEKEGGLMGSTRLRGEKHLAYAGLRFFQAVRACCIVPMVEHVRNVRGDGLLTVHVVPAGRTANAAACVFRDTLGAWRH